MLIAVFGGVGGFGGPTFQAQFGDSRKTVHLMLADSVPGPGFGDLKELLAHYHQNPVTTNGPVRLTTWLGANDTRQVGARVVSMHSAFFCVFFWGGPRAWCLILARA